MSDPRRTGADIYQQVLDIVGDPKHCKKVDSQTRGLVAKLLREQGAGSLDADLAGRAVSGQAQKLCTSMTPEGRAVIILSGAAATVVYGVMNWDEIEPKIQEALRRAKAPLSVPIDKVRLPGTLKLGIGLEAFEADYKLQRGPGTLRVQLENTYETGDSTMSARYSQQTNAGTFKARITHNTANHRTNFTVGQSGTMLGGNYDAGAGYNTQTGGSVFFKFRVTF
ncbi:MAG: hypothetical protein KUG77_00475 [Nannocystaceae bacterium]|nr:hypothetical protein [Nannocystaceae bacterium]